MRRILFLFSLILLLFWPSVHAQPSIEAPVALLMDGDTGQILFEKSSNERCYPASITKILTALLFIENVSLDEKLVVGEDVPSQIEQGSSQIYLIPGEELTGEQLLNALLVESANDAAVVIAERISGSVEAFGEKMTQRARELGALNSHFVNPHGLHQEEHYTTAKDMALIMKEVIKHPELTEIMTRRNYVIPATEYQDTRYLWTKNDLYQSMGNVHYNENVIAGKTGYTTQAGNTLISAAQKGDLTLIAVVLRCTGPMTYGSTNALYDYGFQTFTSIRLLDENQVVKTIQVGKESLELVPAEPLRYTLLPTEQSQVEQVIELPDTLDFPVEKGETLGSVSYWMDNVEIARTGLLAATAMKAPFSLGHFLARLFLGILGFLLVAYLVLRIYVQQRNRKIRKRKLAKKRRGEYAKF